MLLVILIVALIMSLSGGFWGNARYGYLGWSPAGVIFLVLVFMTFSGRIHF